MAAISGHKLPPTGDGSSPLDKPRTPALSIAVVVLGVLANGSVEPTALALTSGSEEFFKDDLLPGASFDRSAVARSVLFDIVISLRSSTES